MRASLDLILPLVSEDLRFAETKNAALLTANAATLIGIAQIVSSTGGVGLAAGVYLVLVTVGSLVSGVINLVSFVPYVHGADAGSAPLLPTDNLLFFGDVRKYRPDDYLHALLVAEDGLADAPTVLERMFAEQIVITSRIAARKFRYFRIALWVALAGLGTPLLAGPIYLYLERRAARPSVPGLATRTNPTTST